MRSDLRSDSKKNRPEEAHRKPASEKLENVDYRTDTGTSDPPPRPPGGVGDPPPSK
jgi:hypothetical protein